jgi:hypothetical protein
MSGRFASLHRFHVEQLLEFLTFDRAVRDRIRQEVKEKLSDILSARIVEEKTYTGREVIDTLEDVPDLVENAIDRELVHQRDIAVVLIKNVFAQAKAKSQTIVLSVSQIEDESILQASHAFCTDLLREPEQTLAAAPETPPEIVVALARPASAPADELAGELAENARLKGEIEAGLQTFPQYGKTLEMLRQRDIELAGLRARL